MSPCRTSPGCPPCAGSPSRSSAPAQRPPASLLRPGHGRPLFLVPDAWGQLNLCSGLVQRLETERPIYGLHVPLVDADGRHRSIEEVAADAVLSVREVQRSGPYSLIGYSFGGLVAHGMAAELPAAGQQVSYLGLLDVRPPETALSRREVAVRRWRARWDDAVSRKAVATVGRRVRALVRPDTAVRAPSSSKPGAPDAEQQFFLRSEQVANQYRPRRFEGTVTYYLAEGSRSVVRETLGAWRRVVGELRVLPVPGHHGDLDDERIGMLSARHVDTLAASVSATLA
jgi:acetoacetyl-CoA synthetase